MAVWVVYEAWLDETESLGNPIVRTRFYGVFKNEDEAKKLVVSMTDRWGSHPAIEKQELR